MPSVALETGRNIYMDIRSRFQAGYPKNKECKASVRQGEGCDSFAVITVQCRRTVSDASQCSCCRPDHTLTGS